MKTPLKEDDKLIRAMLREYWSVQVASMQFIPIGNSAYSYKLMAESGARYYLKIVDLQTASGRRTAARMEFSLPLQRFVAEQSSPHLAAPAPQYTLHKMLSASQSSLLFALYTFIDGATLADSYPMSAALVHRIGQTLAALHSLSLPVSLRRQAPRDQLTLSFEDDLRADLAAVEKISTRDALYLQQLRELIQPKQTYIRAFWLRCEEYRKQAQSATLPTVVCHGDPWGGNMIPGPSDQLILLDWESSLVAPAERDVYTYMGYNHDDFTAFTAGYHEIRQEPVRWNISLLAYYAYWHQLRNLAFWLHNLLHEGYGEEQRANDLEMIKDHCLNRLENVERTAARLIDTLDKSW